MEKQKYQELVKNTTPKPKKLKHSFIAFISGGIIGGVSEIIRLLMINYFNIKSIDAVSIILIFI